MPYWTNAKLDALHALTALNAGSSEGPIDVSMGTRCEVAILFIVAQGLPKGVARGC